MLRGQLIQQCIKVNWFQLDYCYSVLGFKLYSIIKLFLGVNKYISTPVTHGDMGWDPPLIRRKVSMLRLWKRLICMDNTRLTKQIWL